MTPSPPPYFTLETLRFLNALGQNNNHEWFRAHRADYETHVREPAQRLIVDLQEPLAQVSPHFRADPKKVGGSLFRVMRDTRRRHPEGPYKTWIGLRFYHEQKNEAHAPSFYVQLASPSSGMSSFIAGGLWRPAPDVLKRVREFLVANPNAWQAALITPGLASYARECLPLKRMPRGYPEDHPVAPSLRWTSFIWHRPTYAFLAPTLREDIVQGFQDLAPPVDYLCAALDLAF